jgi:hypothetical protein
MVNWFSLNMLINGFSCVALRADWIPGYILNILTWFLSSKIFNMQTSCRSSDKMSMYLLFLKSWYTCSDHVRYLGYLMKSVLNTLDLKYMFEPFCWKYSPVCSNKRFTAYKDFFHPIVLPTVNSSHNEGAYL